MKKAALFLAVLLALTGCRNGSWLDSGVDVSEIDYEQGVSWGGYSGLIDSKS